MKLMSRKLSINFIFLLIVFFSYFLHAPLVKTVRAQQQIPTATIKINNQHGDSLVHALYFDTMPVTYKVSWETTGWDPFYQTDLKCVATGNGWTKQEDKAITGEETYTMTQPGIYNYTITCGNATWGIAIQDWVVAAVGVNGTISVTPPGLSPTIISTSPTMTPAPTEILSPTPTVVCNKKPGEANNDGKVDLKDFEIWKCEYLNHGSCGESILFTPPQISSLNGADFNCDNKVDLVDFEIWRRNVTLPITP